MATTESAASMDPQVVADGFDAIILAGGQGSRLGGVSKADLVVGGVRLLDRVLEGVKDAATTVVVGRVAVPDGVLLTLEDPPGTGPAAGLLAGLQAIRFPAEWTLVLACDLPDAAGAVAMLRAASTARPDADAFAIQGRDGQSEWLLGLYRSSVLRAAASSYGDPRNRSVRRLLGPLAPVAVHPGDVRPDDIDTWADHARWNAYYRRRTTMPEDRSGWRPFVERACAAVGVDARLVDEDAILTMTREVAHAGARPMAPVSAFILGVAVGRGGDPDYLRRVLEDAVSAAPVPQEA